MAETRPTGEQLRFMSEETGEHILDTYLQNAEKGGRTLSDLLDDLFDTDGVFNAELFEFRVNTSTNRLQVRVGVFADPADGWTDTNEYIFRARGAHANATAYVRLDVVTYAGATYICHTAHTSASSVLDSTKFITALTASGDVLGPATNTADHVPQWNGANSKTLKDGRAIGAASSTDILDRAAGDARYQPTGSYQTSDATLTALAALNSDAGLLEQTGADTFTKRALGVAADTSVPTRADADARYQAIDATLTALAAVSTAANKLIYATGSDTFTTADLTAAARTLLAQASQADMRTTGLGLSSDGSSLVSAANYATMLTLLGAQPSDAELTALAGLTSAADKLPYFTGAGTADVTTLSSFIRGLLDDADAATARSTLGLVIGTDVLANVAPGTSGNLLTSNGSAWTSAAAPAAGSWVYLGQVNASAAAEADVEHTFDSTYDQYVIIGTGIRPGTTNQGLRARLKLGGTYQTSSHYNYTFSDYVAFGSNQTDFNLSNAVNMDNAAEYASSFELWIQNPHQAGIYKSIRWSLSNANNDNASYVAGSGAYYNSTAALTGVRLYAASGNITGDFRLYGIRKS